MPDETESSPCCKLLEQAGEQTGREFFNVPYDDVSVVRKCQVLAGEACSPSIVGKINLEDLEGVALGFENHSRGLPDALTLVSDCDLHRIYRY